MHSFHYRITKLLERVYIRIFAVQRFNLFPIRFCLSPSENTRPKTETETNFLHVQVNTESIFIGTVCHRENSPKTTSTTRRAAQTLSRALIVSVAVVFLVALFFSSATKQLAIPNTYIVSPARTSLDKYVNQTGKKLPSRSSLRLTEH